MVSMFAKWSTRNILLLNAKLALPMGAQLFSRPHNMWRTRFLNYNCPMNTRCAQGTTLWLHCSGSHMWHCMHTCPVVWLHRDTNNAATNRAAKCTLCHCESIGAGFRAWQHAVFASFNFAQRQMRWVHPCPISSFHPSFNAVPHSNVQMLGLNIFAAFTQEWSLII